MFSRDQSFDEYRVSVQIDDSYVCYQIFDNSNRLIANISFKTYIGFNLNFTIRSRYGKIINLNEEVSREHRFQEKYDASIPSPYCRIKDMLLSDFKEWETIPIKNMSHVIEFIKDPLGMVERISTEMEQEEMET